MVNFLFSISKDKLSACQKWYKKNGPTPRRKQGGGWRACARSLSLDDINRIYHFIDNYAEQHALALPGRVPGYKRSDLRLLPSDSTKAGIWRNAYKPATVAAGEHLIYRHIILCFKNNIEIKDTVGRLRLSCRFSEQKIYNNY